MASPTTVTQPATGATVDSSLQTVEVALQACTLSDAQSTTAADATQALHDDHAHARAGVAQDTQVFLAAQATAQETGQAGDRRAVWGHWDAQYRGVSEAVRAFLVEQRIADTERDHRWVAEQEQRAAERAAERARDEAEREQRAAERAAVHARVAAEMKDNFAALKISIAEDNLRIRDLERWLVFKDPEARARIQARVNAQSCVQSDDW
ncbi:hypothetical protein HYPSUDRAFT_206638 [Hypholoma sublateritium FD-334 SS-4]|uniref:Uncharacterized protein n=1 Tax=Hypholoma sublateritium (strain FD-334 SS-4) TaxID=945553 RepID=A0A0D2NCY2_HYPSF|nr:hypothetical protein HYPSUDRAFT_206638 [Hypholoma sublateritium FD-334 SS-4]